MRFSGPAFVVASLLAAVPLDAQQPAQSPQPAPAARPAQADQPDQLQAPEAPAQPTPDPLYVLDEAFAKDAATSKTPGLVAPKVREWVRANYTPEAMRRKITGEVWLRVRIGPTGVVEAVRVVKSLDTEHGLDRAAVEAIRAMTFEPGMLDGKPVTTLGDITTSFNLR